MVLEPFLLVRDVGVVEIAIGLGEVDDSLDEADDRADAAKQGKDDLDDSSRGVTKKEFMDAQSAQQDSKDATEHLLLTNIFLVEFRNWCWRCFVHGVPL